MTTNGTTSYDPSEAMIDLRDQSILASARLGISAEAIAKSWGMSPKRVRAMVCEDLAQELGLEGP
jgi:hypothetical protein